LGYIEPIRILRKAVAREQCILEFAFCQPRNQPELTTINFRTLK
jgi:hypothetical protein